jgi:peptidoglycan hydrolase CwlO-like protein
MDESAMETRLRQIEANQGRMDNDIRTLFGDKNELKIAVTELKASSNHLLMAMGKLEGAIEGLKAKPGDRWEKVMYAVISALVAAAVAYFIGGGA